METIEGDNIENAQMQSDKQPKSRSITLELGDIIEIIAPSNPDIH